MLMKVLSHPGHGKSRCCIVGLPTPLQLVRTEEASWMTGESLQDTEISHVAYNTAPRFNGTYIFFS